MQLGDISTLLCTVFPDKSLYLAVGQPTTTTTTTATTNSSGSSHVQAWMQGAIAKISSSNDGSNSTASPISGSPTFMPISINTGTFPGTPAVRLIGDCHFLHRLCQLLLFCFLQRSSRFPQRNADVSSQKLQTGATSKLEEVNSAKPTPALNRIEDAQGFRGAQLGTGVKGIDENSARTTKMGSGNAGQGYTYEEVGTYIPVSSLF